MWIFSELGFYSVNLTPDNSALQFRARKKSDLENLRRDFPKEFTADIMTLPAADYRWRLETTPAKAGKVMAALTARIKYRNFKNHLHGTDQADKLRILHDLWSDLFAYQGQQERPAREFRPEHYARHQDEPFFGPLDAADEQPDLFDFPDPDDEDDSVAPPPGVHHRSAFPDWDGPTRFDVEDGDGDGDEEVLVRRENGWKWEAP